MDSLKGAEPLIHSSCYLFKLHGDCKDSRIRNRTKELSQYPEEFDELLERIFDEFESIVCRWSAEWDKALSRAMVRSKSRRYSMYWTTRREPTPTAEPLAKLICVLCWWGNDVEYNTVIKMVRSLISHATQIRTGNTAYLNLRSYPAVLFVAAYGIGLVNAER